MGFADDGGFGRGGGGGGGFGGASAPMNFAGRTSGDDQGEKESTQVTIPNDMVGAIMGPGGGRIRKIRNDSKANITIADSAGGSNERIITIEGGTKEIQAAQYMLQQAVRENSSQPGGGFGRGGRGGY